MRSEELIYAMKESRGAFETVSEQQIEMGLFALSQRGLYCEPTSAVIVYGIEKLVKKGLIEGEDVVVAVLTGVGLKATDKIAKLAKDYC